MIRVTVWNEFQHERTQEKVKEIYPDGIHTCIAKFLRQEEELSVRTAVFDEKEHGLTEEVLANTDVLVFWNHMLQEEFSDDVAERVRRHVLAGMGLVVLHSGHYSKIMRKLLGTSMTLRWRHGDRERLFCTCPTHPIAQGIPAWVDIPEEEMYGEFFDIPKRMMWYLRDGLQAVRCSAVDAPLHVGWAKFSIFSRDTRNTPFTICR